MGNLLKKMFDFQRIEKEPGLQAVIDDTVAESKIYKLSDFDLELVSAGTELDNRYVNANMTGPTVSFCCRKPNGKGCGRYFDIQLGVTWAKCPYCEEEFTFNG